MSVCILIEWHLLRLNIRLFIRYTHSISMVYIYMHSNIQFIFVLKKCYICVFWSVIN